MFFPIERKEFLSEVFVHYWICHQLGSANLIYKCEKWNKEKEVAFVKCMRQNPRQGLTNLDCVISYPLVHFVIHQTTKNKTDSIILAQKIDLSNGT